MRLRHRALAAGVLAVAGTACSSGDALTDPTTDSTTVPSTTPAPRPSLPDDGNAAFVQLDDGVPAITADGRVFRRVEPPQHGFAAVPLPPPVGALEVAQLTDDGLAEVVRRATELGLLQEPPDYGDPMITDQGSLVVTFSTAGATYEHDVYAPDEEVGDDDAQAARERLGEFVDVISSLPAHMGDEIGPWRPYVPDRWVVDIHPHVEPWRTEPWPFDDVPADGCTTFDVADTDTVSGTYAAAVPGEEDEQLVEVRPALPFTEC